MKIEIEITENTVLAEAGQETRSLAIGEIVELELDDALSIVGAGRGCPLKPLHSALKEASKQR